MTAMSGQAPVELPAAEAIRRALVVSTKFKPEAHDLAREIASLLEGRGVSVILDLPGDLDLHAAASAAGADILICVGGDGTILGTARRLMGYPVPAIGVNIGKLGFLAEFDAEELRAYLRGGPPPGRVVPRLMLKCRCEAAGARPLYALNDAVVAQGPMGVLLPIDLTIDGRLATRYNADGVVVSTPVGSTAYSLSLGGPILTPGADALIVTPIAPHSLTNRPLVLEGSTRLRVVVQRSAPAIGLVIDGQEMVPLRAGSAVEIERAERPFLLAAHAKRSFFDLLRAKFHWGDAPRERV